MMVRLKVTTAKYRAAADIHPTSTSASTSDITHTAPAKKDMASEPQTSKDGPWTEETKQIFEGKSKSQFYDPCQEAAQRSYKCLYRNNGDKNMCGEYFQAYRDCKSAWLERRRKEKGTLW